MQKKLIQNWTVIDLISRGNLGKMWKVSAVFTSGIFPPVFYWNILRPWMGDTYKTDLIEERPWNTDIFLWGKMRHSIVLFDETSPGAKVRPESPLGGAATARCSIRVRPDDSHIELAARIFHEMLHVMGADSDQMDGKDREPFKKYLQVRHPEFATYYENPAPFRENWGTYGQALLLTYYRYLLWRDIAPETACLDYCMGVA